MIFKSDADAADLTSENEMCEVEEDLMESSSDVDSIVQGECFSESELVDRLSKLYTEREFLSDSEEDADKTI